MTVPPATPTCADTTASTPPGGGQATITLTCTAPPGIALSYAVLAGPAHGSVSAITQTNGQLNYLPQTGFVGQDSFTYQAVDPGGASQPATARITVPPPPPRPIASIIGRAKVTVGQPVTYNASVIDSVGTPTAYRWTVAGRQIGSGPTLTHVFTRPGSSALALHVADSAGNVINAMLNVAATSPRLRVKLDFHAEFSIPPKDSKFTSLIARAVPIGTSIRFACSGPACPFATKSYEVTGRTTCGGKRCQKRSTSPPNARDVDLTPALNGVRLPIGTVLTVTFRKPFTIGQVETLTIGATGPTSREACIPLGKARAARRC
ncbi:MAG TPA: PKD domain-containing protein [Gaiellales bacterium]|nr:PKD domain-containing protein [Gaiellales bacterium]